jgi:hypothetical protein
MDRLLQVPTKRRGSRERLVSGAQRQDAIAVNLLEADRQLRPGGRDHARQEEPRLLVSDHQARSPGERGKQPRALARHWLDVRQIRDLRSGERARVVGHALEHERMHPIAGPRIARAQRLEHDQRATQLDRARDRVVERKAPRRAPRGDHPVQDVVTIGRHRRVVHRGDAQARGARGDAGCAGTG